MFHPDSDRKRKVPENWKRLHVQPSSSVFVDRYRIPVNCE